MGTGEIAAANFTNSGGLYLLVTPRDNDFYSR